MRACCFRFVCLLLLTLCGVAAPAWAQPVMVLGVSGDEPNALERGRLHRELIEAVQLSGSWTVGDSSDMPTDEVALVMGCAAPSPTCLVSFAEFTGMNWLLWGTVRAQSDGRWLDVSLFDASTRTTTLSVSIPVSSSRGPAYLPSRLAGELAGTPVVEVRSAEPAYIIVDGVQRGSAPVFLLDLAPGVHEIIARYADGSIDRGTLTVPAAGFMSIEVNDVAQGVVTDAPQRGGSRPQHIVGYSLLGAAGVLAGVGVLFTVDGQRLEAALDTAPTQREAFDLADTGRQQMRTGNIFYGAAGATALTGLILALTGRGDRTDPVAFDILPNGVQFRAQF